MRGILKKECATMGVTNHWILDGTGSICGVPVGQSAGNIKDLLPELQKVLASDGVHLKPEGYRNLAGQIVNAIEGVSNGTLTKSAAAKSSAGQNAKPKEFFWKGFISPTGDIVGRAMSAKQHPPRGPQRGVRMQHQQFQQFQHFHPYRKRF
jgi:hypothetical protein